MRRKLPLFAVIAALGLSIAVAIHYIPPAVTSVAAEVSPQQQTATLAVENMTCAMCPVTVRKAMENVKGVKSVDVDFSTKTATVVYDPAITAVEKIAAASTNAGYPAQLSY